MSRRKIDPERELQWYYRGGPNTLKSPGFDPRTSGSDPTNMSPDGIDCSRSRAGWTTRYGGGWTSDDLAAIETALGAISAADRSTLREHHTPHPVGRLAGLTASFDVWAPLSSSTPTARSRAGQSDGTAIREWLRSLCHRHRTGSKDEKKAAGILIRQIRREALEKYIGARDAYESARRLLSAIKLRKVTQ